MTTTYSDDISSEEVLACATSMLPRGPTESAKARETDFILPKAADEQSKSQCCQLRMGESLSVVVARKPNQCMLGADTP